MTADLEALELELLERPDDDELLSVYADALIEQGDRRGELAAIHRAQRDGAELDQAERDFLHQHGKELLGIVGDPNPRPRAHDRHAKNADKSGVAGYELGWRLGHLDSIVIAEPFGAEPTAAEVLRDLIDRPVARFLNSISLERTRGFAASPNQVWAQMRRRDRAVVDVIAASARPALRSLSFGMRHIPFDLAGEDDARGAVTHAGGNLGDLAELWQAAPNLESVLFSGCHLELETMNAPNLRSLELRYSHIPRVQLAFLNRASLPKLESLTVWLGAGDYGDCSYRASSLEPLCDPERLPALRHLGFVCSSPTESILAMLLDSPMLPRLETLDLRGGLLEDTANLMRNADRLAHLEIIDLSWNALTDVDEVRDVLPNAILEPQRFEPEVPRFNACME